MIKYNASDIFGYNKLLFFFLRYTILVLALLGVEKS
jgi:hypothetical protein